MLPADQRPTVIIQQPGGLSRWFSWLGWVGLMLCIPVILGMSASYQEYFDTSDGIREKYHSRSKTSADKIAIIQAVGLISESDGFVKSQIDRIRKDDHVRAVVLRIDSPGGTVTASDYLYHHLCKLRDERKIPMVVSMGGLAASGGYYISMVSGDQEDSIFAEPTTTTGSIGVIIPHFNISSLLEEYGIANDSIVSHPRKELLSMTKPPSPDDRAILQRYVDQSFGRFKEIVKSGRPKFRDQVIALDQLATGEIFTAEQALELGLVDKIGFIEDAVDRAAEMAGLNKVDMRVVTFEQPMGIRQALGFAQSTTMDPQQSLEAAILQLTVPKAYYLLTTLPAMAGR